MSYPSTHNAHRDLSDDLLRQLGESEFLCILRGERNCHLIPENADSVDCPVDTVAHKATETFAHQLLHLQHKDWDKVMQIVDSTDHFEVSPDKNLECNEFNKAVLVAIIIELERNSSFSIEPGMSNRQTEFDWYQHAFLNTIGHETLFIIILQSSVTLARTEREISQILETERIPSKERIQQQRELMGRLIAEATLCKEHLSKALKGSMRSQNGEVTDEIDPELRTNIQRLIYGPKLLSRNVGGSD